MESNKKYQIFISSTYKDLVNARAKVTETILSMYHFPIGMEMFSAGDDDQWTVIKRTIDISDYYVLIVGHRYGSVAKEGYSYTEKEYNYAKSKGLPILAFIKDRNAATKPLEREHDYSLQKKLDSFVTKSMSSKMCDFWKTEDELASKVSIALIKEFMNNPRSGWVRADSLTEKKKVNNVDLRKTIKLYLDDKERMGLGVSTLKTYSIELRIFQEYFNDKSIEEISTEHIKEFLRHREDDYNINSKSSLERIRGILGAFFEWLIQESILTHSPVKKVRAFRFPQVVIDILDDNEINELRGVCNTPRERALIEFLLSTGCKLGEIENLSLDNINWEKGYVSVTGLSHRNRAVLLNIEAAEQLKKYLDTREDNENYIFVTERKPHRALGRRAIQQDISTIAERTDISKKISPKTFRHTFARKMLNKGIPLNIVQSLLGNKEYTSTAETYNKITDENINHIIRAKRY